MEIKHITASTDFFDCHNKVLNLKNFTKTSFTNEIYTDLLSVSHNNQSENKKDDAINEIICSKQLRQRSNDLLEKQNTLSLNKQNVYPNTTSPSSISFIEGNKLKNFFVKYFK